MKGKMNRARMLLMACLLACLTAILCLFASRHAVKGDVPQAGDAFGYAGNNSAAQKQTTDDRNSGGMRGHGAGGHRVKKTGEGGVYPSPVKPSIYSTLLYILPTHNIKTRRFF